MKKFWGDHYIFDVYSNCIFHQANLIFSDIVLFTTMEAIGWILNHQ